MLEEITHESFESIVGETVDIEAAEINFQAEVEAVTRLRQSTAQERQPFSVVLQAKDAKNHGQQTYQLSHPGLGELHLFMVPVGPGENGMRYEIIFN